MEVPRLRGQRKAGGRKEGCNGFLGKGGSEGGEAAVRVPGFLLDVFSELGKANPSPSGERLLCHSQARGQIVAPV